jgi:hypothetical protein
MSETLTHSDIHKLLKIISTSIELDQLRVDAVPTKFLHPSYNDEMWRAWRAKHVAYINKLLPTINALTPATLRELTDVAATCAPKAIGKVVLELFADAVSGSCEEEEFSTAERLFGWLIKQAHGGAGRQARKGDAKAAILAWLPVSDPLWIARDPECGYGRVVGAAT